MLAAGEKYYSRHYHDYLFMPMAAAQHALRERQQNRQLIDRVCDFLNDQIPQHFRQTGPFFYLSRHVASPNREVTHASGLARLYNMPLVIGEDRGCPFSSTCEDHLALGVLPMVTSKASQATTVVEPHPMINLDEAIGQPLSQVQLIAGGKLIDFHHAWCARWLPKWVLVADETRWVDAGQRFDVVRQYERLLALQCVHGIMIDSFAPEDQSFVEDVVVPAFAHVERRLGVRPLMVEQLGWAEQAAGNWLAYSNHIFAAERGRLRALAGKMQPTRY